MTRNFTILGLLGFHFLLGWVSSKTDIPLFIVGVIPLFVGAITIVKNKNRNHEAALWSAYYVGLELLLRMTGAGLTYEIGKYAVCFFLFLGLASESYGRNLWTIPVFYFVLLLPSILLTISLNVPDLRKVILFNLSGPLTLTLSIWYFRRRVVSEALVKKLLLCMLLPIISVAVYITFMLVDYSKIEFTSESNSFASGGFGPNQVSTMLSLGMLILGFSLIQRLKLFKYEWISIGLLAFLTYRAVLTFSRGGVFSTIISLVVCFILTYFVTGRSRGFSYSRLLFFTGILVFLGFLLWGYINDITGGQLYNRYTGRSTSGKVMETGVTGGRQEILETEWQIFLDNPVTGVGLGLGKAYRSEKLGIEIATHNEFGRLLAEHGLLGAIAVLLLLMTLAKDFFFKYRVNVQGAVLLATFASYSVLTLSHSGMRVAMPGFIMGIGMVLIWQPKWALSSIRPSIHAKNHSGYRHPQFGRG